MVYFFQFRLDLVAVHIIITHGQHKLGSANFILSVALPMRMAFTAELCGILSICKLIEWFMSSYSIFSPITITVNSDCSSALRFLSLQPKLISNSISLYQIKQKTSMQKTYYTYLKYGVQHYVPFEDSFDL